VLAQSFTDFEVLVADDASTDDTGEMLRRIGDPRIRHLRHEKNKGVSAARNTALAHASGEFIAFLDDDDEWLPEKLNVQVDLLGKASASVGLVYGGFYNLNGSTNQVEIVVMPSQRGRLFEALLRRGSFSHASAILARAECFERVGLFDVSIRYGEDFDMWLRIAKEYEIDFVPMPVARRYMHPDGLTQNYAAIISGSEMLLKKYNDFFREHSSVLNERLYQLGTYYCFAGDTRRGRQAFVGAIASRPLALKSYAGLLLSLMGSRVFRSYYAAKQAMGQ
jgi:glycosyltransferase involved in cell wall biosynthesis